MSSSLAAQHGTGRRGISRRAPAMLRPEQAAPPGSGRRRRCAGAAAGLAELCRARSRHQQLPAADRPPPGGGFRVVDAFSRIVRLGEGLAATGALSEAAMARTIEALRVCAGKIGQRKCRFGRYVATEACRRAGNCAELPRPGARRTRHRARDHLDRRGGAAGGDRLRAAAASAHPVCDRLRHRRRLDRDRLAAPSARRAARTRNCRSSARCRCRSGSSPLPSGSAASR